MKKLFGRVASAFGAKTSPKTVTQDTLSGQGHTRHHIDFEPHNELEERFVMAVKDPNERRSFEKLLLEADLYAATPEPPPLQESWRTLEAGEQVSLLNVTGVDGHQIAAVFTSEARIVEAFGPGTGFIKMKGEALLDLISKQGAILNPRSTHSVHWTPEQLAALLGKPVSWTVQKDTKVMLGTPAELPEELVSALQTALTAEAGISSAWLALAYWPEPGEFSWYLDIRTPLSGDEIHRLLAPAFKAAALGDRPLNMIVNPPGGAEGAGIRLVPVQVD